MELDILFLLASHFHTSSRTSYCDIKMNGFGMAPCACSDLATDNLTNDRGISFYLGNWYGRYEWWPHKWLLRNNPVSSALVKGTGAEPSRTSIATKVTRLRILDQELLLWSCLCVHHLIHLSYVSILFCIKITAKSVHEFLISLGYLYHVPFAKLWSRKLPTPPDLLSILLILSIVGLAECKGNKRTEDCTAQHITLPLSWFSKSPRF